MDKLHEHEADLLENLMIHEGWKIIVRIIEDRVEAKRRQLEQGRCKTYDEYVAVCESIRDGVYLRDRPMQMISEARRKR